MSSMNTTQIPPLNDKLIDCVVRHISQHPDEYQQNFWARVVDQKQDGEMCGTQACAAGWAVLLSTPVAEWRSNSLIMNESAAYFYSEGQARLGLTYDEARHLFESTIPTRAKDPEVIKQRLRDIRRWRGLPPREYGLPEPADDSEPEGVSEPAQANLFDTGAANGEGGA